MTAPKALAMLAVALLSAGCANFGPFFTSTFRVGPNRDLAARTQPVADPYQQALYQGYRAKADEQNYKGDYYSADIFYRKAIAAAQGQAVPPEEAGAWIMATGLRARGLHGADLQAVQTMRPRLIDWQNRIRPTNSVAAATQQVNFDCWVEELNEQDYDDAKPCEPQLTIIAAPQPPAPVPVPPRAQPFLVFFDFDRSEITPEADRILRSAAEAWKRGQSPRVDVTGHADRSGSDAYNQRLSERRAVAVRARLVQHGVSAGAITALGRGETQPLVPTADGVREPQNRRAEIDIKP